MFEGLNDESEEGGEDDDNNFHKAKYIADILRKYGYSRNDKGNSKKRHSIVVANLSCPRINYRSFGIAVDSSNPEVVIVSASNGHNRSYVAKDAETFVYRKDAADGNRWKTVTAGLPKARGSTIMSFASNAKTPGEFYGVNNHGLFLSTDAGSSWKKLDTLWPREYLQQTPWAIAINER